MIGLQSFRDVRAEQLRGAVRPIKLLSVSKTDSKTDRATAAESGEPAQASFPGRHARLASRSAPQATGSPSFQNFASFRSFRSFKSFQSELDLERGETELDLERGETGAGQRMPGRSPTAAGSRSGAAALSGNLQFWLGVALVACAFVVMSVPVALKLVRDAQ